MKKLHNSIVIFLEDMHKTFLPTKLEEASNITRYPKRGGASITSQSLVYELIIAWIVTTDLA